MAESQSRYSIVERLTVRKLEIMSSKSSLQEELLAQLQRNEELKNDLTNWEKDIEEDIRREKRNKQRTIEKAEQDHDNTKTRLAEKERIYDTQIKAIEEALKSIEEISKSQTSQSS